MGEGGGQGGKGGECRDRLRWPSSDAIMNLGLQVLQTHFRTCKSHTANTLFKKNVCFFTTKLCAKHTDSIFKE